MLNLLILKCVKDRCGFSYFYIDFVGISTEYGQTCLSVIDRHGFQVSFRGVPGAVIFFLDTSMTRLFNACTQVCLG